MGATGLSALIHLAAALEVDHGAETIALGRAAVDDADCVLETGGRHLAYRVALHGDGEVRTAAALMDDDGAYQTLLRSRDDAGGWRDVRNLIRALEESAVRSLRRPIEATSDSNNPWVIG
jgi:hypothetical protein